MDVDGSGPLEEIGREECLRLLASLSVGRIAVALPGEPPLVVPVNYVLDGEVVVFRSEPGSKVHAARKQPVSFEVDYVDPFHQTGWSVLVQGAAYEATAREVRNLWVVPWAGGKKDHWIRIVPKGISGRRIRRPEALPLDQRGYA